MDFYLYLTLKGLPYDLYLLLEDLLTGEAHLYVPEPRPWPLPKRRGLIKLETLCVLDVIGTMLLPFPCVYATPERLDY